MTIFELIFAAGSFIVLVYWWGVAYRARVLLGRTAILEIVMAVLSGIVTLAILLVLLERMWDV